MTCNRAMDLIFGEKAEGSDRVTDRLRARLHLLRCGACAREVRRVEEAVRLLRTARKPAGPDLTDSIMAAVRLEVAAAAEEAADSNVEAVMPTRHWVLVGLILVASLAVSPLGAAFDLLVRLLGSDLLFPLSLTLGAVLTAYCALFIGSHLDELSERFGLRRAG